MGARRPVHIYDGDGQDVCCEPYEYEHDYSDPEEEDARAGTTIPAETGGRRRNDE